MIKCKKILVFSLLLNFILILLSLYAGSIDDYAPHHSGVAYNLISGDIDEKSAHDIMRAECFYYLLAIVILLTNINVNLITSYPFAVFPYLMIFFALIYRLSNKNMLLSLLLSMITISSATMGSHQIYIWMHGIGDILLYTFFLLIAILWTDINTNNTKIYILTIILVNICILFMSYNTSYKLFLFLLFFTLINSIISVLKGGRLRHKIFLFNNIVLVLIIRLGLSDFFFEVFLPDNVLDSSVDYKYIITKFFLQYIGIESHETSPLLQYAFTYPNIITYTWIFKYIIYISMITTCCLLIYKRQNKNELIDINTLFFVTLLCITISYFISRFFVGQFAITGIFGLFWISTIIVYNKITKISYQKSLVILILVIMILINITNILIANEYELVNKGKYEYIVPSLEWVYEFSGVPIFLPDILTYDYCYNTYSMNEYSKLGYIAPRMLKFEYIKRLYTGERIGNELNIMINYQATHNNVQNWNNLIPFKDIKEIIDNNPSIESKIYDNLDISIYNTE